MPNYNDAQGVADLLSQFDFNIISEGIREAVSGHSRLRVLPQDPRLAQERYAAHDL